MSSYSIGQAARLLGVSGETVRRWADSGRLTMGRDGTGNRVIDGVGLARFAKSRAAEADRGVAEAPRTSVRNSFTGIVTAPCVSSPARSTAAPAVLSAETNRSALAARSAGSTTPGR